MTVRRILAGIIIVLGFCGATLDAQSEEPEQAANPSYWMRKKLEYSEKILSALATEDYAQISKNARAMNALNQMEKWVRGSTPEYRGQLKIFANANEQLIRTAEDKNLDGAALAYVQLTLSCVNCHKVVRQNLREATTTSP